MRGFGEQPPRQTSNALSDMISIHDCVNPINVIQTLGEIFNNDYCLVLSLSYSAEKLIAIKLNFLVYFRPNKTLHVTHGTTLT